MFLDPLYEISGWTQVDALLLKAAVNTDYGQFNKSHNT